MSGGGSKKFVHFGRKIFAPHDATVQSFCNTKLTPPEFFPRREPSSQFSACAFCGGKCRGTSSAHLTFSGLAHSRNWLQNVQPGPAFLLSHCQPKCGSSIFSFLSTPAPCIIGEVRRHSDSERSSKHQWQLQPNLIATTASNWVPAIVVQQQCKLQWSSEPAERRWPERERESESESESEAWDSARDRHRDTGEREKQAHRNTGTQTERPKHSMSTTSSRGWVSTSSLEARSLSLPLALSFALPLFSLCLPPSASLCLSLRLCASAPLPPCLPASPSASLPLPLPLPLIFCLPPCVAGTAGGREGESDAECSG